MVVSDLYRVIYGSENVDIYDINKQVTIFSGMANEINEDYMELLVNSVYIDNDVLVITVK